MGSGAIPPLPKGYEPIQKAGEVPPLPAGYEPIKKKVSDGGSLANGGNLPDGTTVTPLSSSPSTSKKRTGSIDFESSSLQEGDIKSQQGDIPTIELYDTGTDLIEPDPISLAKEYGKLNTKKKQIPGGGSSFAMGTGGMEVADEDAKKQAEKIKVELEKQGYNPDELNDKFKDVPEELYNVKGFTKGELLQLKKDNPQKFDRTLETGKLQFKLKDEIDKNANLTDEEKAVFTQSMIAAQDNSSVGDYDQRRSTVRDLSSLVNEFGGDKKDELKKSLAIDRAKTYGESFITAKSEYFTNDPASKYLDNDQVLARQYLQDTDPEKAKGFDSILIDPNLVKGNQDAEAGWQGKMLRLKELGVGLQQSYVQEEINDLSKIQKEQGGLTPEQQQKAEFLTLKQEGLNEQLAQARVKYPVPNRLDRNQIAQDILGQQSQGLFYTGEKTAQSVINTGKGIWDMVSEPFRGEENSKLHQLKTAGEDMYDKDWLYLSNDNTALQTTKTKISPELQTQIDAVKADGSLDYTRKLQKVNELLAQNPDKWARENIKGGKVNLSPSSLFYSVSDLAATLVPFIALETATAGIGGVGYGAKFARTFSAAIATSFHDEYAAAIQAGEANPFSHALRVSAINGAALAGAGTPDAIRKMLGTKTAIGEMVSKMDDDAIKAMLKTQPSALKNFANAVGKSFTTSTKEAVKITAFTTGGGLVNQAISGEEIDPEMTMKGALVSTLTFALGGGLAGVKGAYSKIDPLQSDGLLRASKQPTQFIEAASEQLKAGAITPEQFTQIKSNIEKAAAVSKDVKFVDNDGNPLSNKAASKLLLLKMQEADIAEQSKGDIPPKLKEKLDAELEDINKEKEKIFEEDTKLSEPIEGVDEQGVPIGDNVPAPVDLKAEVKPVTSEVKADEVENTVLEYDELPQNVKDIVDKYGEANDKTDFNKKLEEAGYTTEYDAESFGTESGVTFRKIEPQQSGKDAVLDEGVVDKPEAITKLEQERDAEIKKVIKPDLKLELVSSKDLVDSKDPIGNKDKHNEIKERYKNLRKLIDCF